MTLYLGTNRGVVIAEGGPAGWSITGRSLTHLAITTIIAREGVVLVGSREGIHRSEDNGQSWQATNEGLIEPYVRWLAYHPDISDFELAGSEPAGIFISRDGAESWQSCPEVAALRDTLQWSLPYSPAAGCVRGFAVHGQRLYAAVEVGGVLRSDDGGQHWQLVSGSDGYPRFGRPHPGFVHPDVHSLVIHPHSADWLLAPTGGGLYRSVDGGQNWALLYDCYCRAAWWDETDPLHIVFGPAGGVDRLGRLEESFDGGISWHPAGTVPTAPWPRYMAERLYAFDGQLFAVLSNGQLLLSPLNSWQWQAVLAPAGTINALWQTK